MKGKQPPPLSDSQKRLLLSTPYDDLTKVFMGYSRRWLMAQKKKLQTELDPTTLVDIDRERLTLKAHIRDLKRSYASSINQIGQLKDEIAQLSNLPDVTPKPITVQKNGTAREATLVALASDWHAEESVTLEQTNGLNEFNLKVFERRSSFYFQRLAEILKKESQSIAIPRLVLWVGGDMISGNIHEELAETNLLQPMNAMALVQDTLAGGFSFLRSEFPDVALTVIASVGNHSRITKQSRIQNEQGYSLEWYMGHSLARAFQDDPGIAFVREPAYHTYIQMYDTTLRFHHGHRMKYGGGIGGITIPINKRIAAWNKGRAADYDCFGHFHQLFYGPKFVANGSMIGFNSYAITIGAEYERPAQATFLIDSEYGMTGREPIFLEAIS
jgi:hypothetical protein